MSERSGHKPRAPRAEPAPPGTGGGAMRTPWQRRLVYGANVAMLVAAVAVIVVLGNWIAVDKVRQWGSWARLDLTATRKYSLSEQSRRLLRGLEQPVRITTVFAEGVGLSEATRRRMRYFRDLLEEYERLSGGQIAVEHVDPSVDIEAYDRLARRVRQHYADELASARSALDAARRALSQTRQRLQRINAYIADRVGSISGAAPELANWMRRAGLPISERAADDLGFDDLESRIDDLEAQTLADYGSVRQSLLRTLRRLDEAGYQRFLDQLEGIDEGEGAADAAVEFAAGLRTLVEAGRSDLERVIDRLEAAKTEAYASTRRSLQQSHSVLISTDEALTTIELESVYAAATGGGDDQQATEQRFRGEEAVTGAIVTLTLDVKPMAVFVNPLPTAATGPRGIFSHVAERLGSMNFEVREWRTGPSEGRMGQRPPTPRPEPAEGQPVVWVYLAPPPDPRMMMSPGLSGARRDLADTLDAGGNALVLVPFWPYGGGGGRSGNMAPVYVEPLASIGIDVEPDARIHVQRPAPDGQTRGVPQVELTDWPQAHPIGRAVAGQPGVLVSAVPMSAREGAAGERWPLIRTPAHAWAESGLADNPAPDEGERTGPMTVGFAAQRGDQRVVAIGDALFAIDQVTQAGPRQMMTGRLLRAQYPGNAELFVNSVYWLAGLEELVATSPRTQDVRRFEPISPTAGRVVEWLALVGLPLFCLGIGAVVWLVRRT